MRIGRGEKARLYVWGRLFSTKGKKLWSEERKRTGSLSTRRRSTALSPGRGKKDRGSPRREEKTSNT